jgi:immunity protein 22 of polymorphic toxin system
MAIWNEDDDRDELAIWLGRFSNATDLKRYAIGQFRKELGLPETKYFEITCLQCAYSDDDGAKEAIAGLLWSQSFLTRAVHNARQMKLLNANGAIAVNSYFSKDANSLDTSRAAFLGYVSFDSEAPRAVPRTPAYFNDRKVSIWACYFRTKAKFEKYFSLDDQSRRTPNKLATDFEIRSYETDFASWVTASGMTPESVSKLLKDFPLTIAFRKKIAAKAADRGLTEATVIYMAYKVDYDQIGKAAVGEKRCKGVVRYIGSFDSPSLESQMQIVRRRAMKKNSEKHGRSTTRKTK